MSNQREVVEAIFGRLRSISFTPAIPIAYPNVEFTPPFDQKWIKAEIFHTQSTIVGLDDDDANALSGFAQFSVFNPAGAGIISSMNVAESIRAAFARGTRLHLPKGHVLFTAARINDTSTTMTPVTAYFTSILPNK
jgi:hypothetical protein